MDPGVLCYEFAAVWWSLLGHLAKESSKQGPGKFKLQQGLRVLKRRLVVYYQKEKIFNRLPLKRFSLRSLKAKPKRL